MNLKIFCESLEDSAQKQLNAMKDNKVFLNQKIRIMPDCHSGNSCVVGLTSTLGDYINPAIVGVDIGCGVTTILLYNVDIDFEKLDKIIHENIPYGFEVHDKINDEESGYLINKLICKNHLINKNRLEASLGTLGGGNHFIEVAEDSYKNKYLLIHSGSRNLGLQVANHYLSISENGVLDSLLKKQYMHDMEVCTFFAYLNRRKILSLILKDLLNCSLVHLLADFNVDMIGAYIDTVHNYIGDDNIIRKGAVSAKLNEYFTIPINMKDGTLLCKGKGNIDWNCSAPHGAGRLLARKEAKKILQLDDFKNEMNNIYSTCINENTLDESPMCYKDIEYIKRMIEPTCEIVDILKPLYNFKAH